MKYNCPTCSSAILAENINVQTDLALCKSCGHITRLTGLVDEDAYTHVLQSPPKGAWYRQALTETVFGATTRHPSAFLMVPFMCVWSGFSLGGIYGGQIASGKFSLLISLFGLPFLVGSIALGSVAIMAVCGKVEVRLSGCQGILFVGVGPLGWKRTFNLNDVTRISEDGWTAKYPGGDGGSILIEGRKRLRFATTVSEARRYFLLNALKAAHAAKN